WVAQEHHSALEGVVGGDQVRAAAEHEQLFPGGVGGGDRLDDLVGTARLDQAADLAADAEGGEVREPHAAPCASAAAPVGRARVARARPSTLVPSTSAVRSTRAVPASSSIA